MPTNPPLSQAAWLRTLEPELREHVAAYGFSRKSDELFADRANFKALMDQVAIKPITAASVANYRAAAGIVGHNRRCTPRKPKQRPEEVPAIQNAEVRKSLIRRVAGWCLNLVGGMR